MREQQHEFDRRTLPVVAIGQGDPADARVFLNANEVSMPLLVDPDQGAYRAYGLARGSAWQIAMTPSVLAAGAAAAREGHWVRRPMGDPMQLPGSFVVLERTVVFAHRGKTSADIAPPDALLAAFDSATPQRA